MLNVLMNDIYLTTHITGYADNATEVAAERHCNETTFIHGPLTRHEKLRVAHAPGMPGTFSPPPTSNETASKWSRHALRHVRHERAVMHVGVPKPAVAGKTLPAFTANARPAILCIWQDTYGDRFVCQLVLIHVTYGMLSARPSALIYLYSEVTTGYCDQITQ